MVEKAINLSPSAEDSTAYQPSGSVSTRDFKILRRKVDNQGATLQTQITQNAEAIVLKAEKSYVDSQDNALQSQITVNAGNIDLRVLKTDYNGSQIVSYINLQPDTIKISAKNLTLDGLVTFTNLSTAGQTTINGGNITTGTMSADRIYGGTINGNTISVINLNASSINSGTINADRINAGYLSAGTVGGWSISGSSLSGPYGNVVLSKNGGANITFEGSDLSGGTLNFANGGQIGNYGSQIAITKGITLWGGIQFSSNNAYNIGSSSVRPSNIYVNNYLYAGNISSGSIYPLANGTDNLGSTTLRWADVWCTDGAFNGSDIRLKKDVAPIDKGIELILGLNPVQWKWNWKEGRNHWGFIANELKVKMDELGIDGGVYADPKVDPNYNEEEDPNGHLALRYTELIAPMVQTIQHLNERITNLENTRAL